MGIVLPVRRHLRPAAKRLLAMLRWRHRENVAVPPLFGNSKPKSGSHLLLQLLDGLTRIVPYAYVRADPVRTMTKTGKRRPEADIAADLGKTPADVIGWGYVEATPQVRAILCQPDRVNYFLYRDPRDLLVSQVHFATDMRNDHGMHDYYNSLPDFAERLKVAITGLEQAGLRMVSVKQRYAAVLEWMDQPGVLLLRYEDLVNSPAQSMDAMLAAIEKTGYEIRFDRAAALRVLRDHIRPQKSATFRSGTPGAWRECFEEEHKVLFKEVAGDLLQRLGYEERSDW